MAPPPRAVGATLRPLLSPRFPPACTERYPLRAAQPARRGGPADLPSRPGGWGLSAMGLRPLPRSLPECLRSVSFVSAAYPCCDAILS